MQRNPFSTSFNLNAFGTPCNTLQIRMKKRGLKIMQNTLHIQCPNELLISLQLNVESFAEIVKFQTAIALFKQGKISSGLAAKWLNISRINFLMQVMEAGAELLEDSEDDFIRETQLL